MNKICSVNAQSTFKDNPNNMSTEASDSLDENLSIDAEFIQMNVKTGLFSVFLVYSTQLYIAQPPLLLSP